MNKQTDLTALVGAIIEDQVKDLETQIRSTAKHKAVEYITELFSKKRIRDDKGNIVTVAAPMLEFVQKKIEKLALKDETHELIDAYIRENFQRVLQEELDIAIRDKARHEARKRAFNQKPGTTPEQVQKPALGPSANNTQWSVQLDSGHNPFYGLNKP